MADRSPGERIQGCAHDILGDKGIFPDRLLPAQSPPYWELLEDSRCHAFLSSSLAQSGLSITVPDWVSGGLPTRSSLDRGLGEGCEDCSEPTNGHFLLVTAGTFLVYYTWFLQKFPFPGAGHLSSIDKIREIKLEKVM